MPIIDPAADPGWSEEQKCRASKQAQAFRDLTIPVRDLCAMAMLAKSYGAGLLDRSHAAQHDGNIYIFEVADTQIDALEFALHRLVEMAQDILGAFAPNIDGRAA